MDRAFAGYHLINLWLEKVTVRFAIPNEGAAVPPVGIVMPGPTRRADIRENVGGTVPAHVPSCPRATFAQAIRQAYGVCDIFSGVPLADDE